MTALDVGVAIVLAAFVLLLCGVWAGRPLPVRDRGRR